MSYDDWMENASEDVRKLNRPKAEQTQPRTKTVLYKPVKAKKRKRRAPSETTPAAHAKKMRARKRAKQPSKSAPSEHQIQVKLFNWVQWKSLEPEFAQLALMFAIPNGGLRNKITAKKMKAEGAKAGVPDIFLPVARGDYHGLFIEMKRPKTGRLQETQKTWITALEAQGYCVAICYGLIPAQEILQDYLNGDLINSEVGRCTTIR